MDAFKIIKSIQSTPVAPFFEHRLIRQLENMAKKLPDSISLRHENNGVLVLNYQGRGDNLPEIGFTAHTDHPGFLLSRLPDGNYAARLEGGFSDEQIMSGAELRLVNHSNREVAGSGKIVDKISDGLFRLEPSDKDRTFTIATPSVKPRVKGDLIYGPVMDDFAGVAMGFDVLERIAHRRLPVNASLILYRGEEAGFVGIYDFLTSGKVSPNMFTISLETSSRVVKGDNGLEHIAEVGVGPILRTGDKLTEQYDETALRLLRMGAKSEGIEVQEKRMTGGTCDASLMYAVGLPAACVCLPLKNYHNGLYESNTFEPEVISRHDLMEGVKLLSATAERLAAHPRMARNIGRRLVGGTSARVIGRIREIRESYNARGLLEYSSE